MKNIIEIFIHSLMMFDQPILKQVLDQDCLLIHIDQKSSLGIDKVIDTLFSSMKEHRVTELKLLNSVPDAQDTLLIAYQMTLDQKQQFYGSSVVRFKQDKIAYIKNFIIS